MPYQAPPQVEDAAYGAVLAAHRADEADTVAALLPAARFAPTAHKVVRERARRWVEEARRRYAPLGMETLLHEYRLSTEEGVLLMCLAEAVLRIPDDATADRLIHDKMTAGRWMSYLHGGDSLMVNASAWGLWLGGQVARLEDAPGMLARLLGRMGEPLVRRALRRAVRLLGWQFILGRTLDEGIRRARAGEAHGYRYSYDMLGEAARTDGDARRYWNAYTAALDALAPFGATGAGGGAVRDAPGVSVKLSALHPRFEPLQAGRCMDELLPRLRSLAAKAAAHGLGLTIDAEESERLDLTVACVEAILAAPPTPGWSGLGVAVQAYQKRAAPLVDYLVDLARRHGRPLSVRLVKGAYWDVEIKRAQQLGLDGYPVFTRKPATDVSYLACARRLLEARDAVHPAFATHNAHTLSAVLELAGGIEGYEVQRLHGMGEPIHDVVTAESGLPCRIYAPIGGYEELLPYLVRRLLENGANTSFINRFADPEVDAEALAADPVEVLERRSGFPHRRIPLPVDLYGGERRNAVGVDLSDTQAVAALLRDGAAALAERVQAVPPVGGDEVAEAAARATAAQPEWDGAPVLRRAEILDRYAELLEANLPELAALCAAEAGKTVADAVAEVREAVDFTRYYAVRARAEFDEPLPLPGPTGESNTLSLHGRGVFACISPWNFPLAIFTGQVTAALAAGNAVLAKPAEQTPRTAARAVELLHRAGVPDDVLHLLPGPGETVGAALVADPRVAGVAFTGSTATAREIARRLAARSGPLVPLIAETGGINAMVVDSSALPEQVVVDVIASAFGACGQRCSALRLLCVQEDVADRILAMLAGAMAELRIGDPWDPATDVGPVIDGDALAVLRDYERRLEGEARLIHRCAAPAGEGFWFPPQMWEVDGVARVDREVFGPVLHVLRYPGEALERVVDEVNALGYGLTFGVHSRLDSTIRRAAGRIRAGNRYVNRNMVGAVVGCQPFGGERLSGAGPHAGGPHYLHAFCVERVLTVNTAASGGNSVLLALGDE